MQTYVAEVHELVRSMRRDEEHLREMEDSVNHLVKELLGNLAWMKAYRFMGDITRLIYYSSTNLLSMCVT